MQIKVSNVIIQFGSMLLSEGKNGFGSCDLHEEDIEEDTYRYKGCWGCQYFEFGQTFPYLFVSEATEELMVSESTIRRLIKKGILVGELFEQQRTTHSLPSPYKYHISKESLRKMLENKVRT